MVTAFRGAWTKNGKVLLLQCSCLNWPVDGSASWTSPSSRRSVRCRMPETAMLPCPFRVPFVLGKRGRAIIREGPGPAALRERPQTRKHGERASSGATSSSRRVLPMSRQPRACEFRSKLAGRQVSGSFPGWRTPDGCPRPQRQSRARAEPGPGKSSPTTGATAGSTPGHRGRRSGSDTMSLCTAPASRIGGLHRPVVVFRFPGQTPTFGPDSAPDGT